MRAQEAQRTHGAAAPRTHERRWRGRRWRREHDAREDLHQGATAARVAVQEAVVTHALEAAWQDVDQELPEELDERQGTEAPGARLGFAIAEGDEVALAIEGDDVAFAQDAAVEIPGEVFERREPGADALAVHNPLRGQAEIGVQGASPQGIAELRAEHLGEGAAVEQVPAVEGPLLSPLAVDAAAGNDDVQVRVVFETPVVGVEHGARAELGTQVRVVGAEGHQGVEQRETK